MSKIISEQRPTGSLRVRQNFAKIPQVIGIPNLIEIQKKSFEYFLQSNVAPGHRKLRGLEEVFHDVFPISDLVKERGEHVVVTLMGIAMKEVRGKASGKMVNDLLRKKVSEL